MTKDDYDVIVYRVLVYYYACLKRKIIFDKAGFNAAVKKDIESDEYFYDVLRMMQDEGLNADRYVLRGEVIARQGGEKAIRTRLSV